MRPEQMQAWRFYALDDMRLDTVPYPEVKPGWVILKTRVVQPSITEVIRAQGLATMDSDYITRVIRERPPVQLFGHEFCAEVVEVGDGVEGFKVGDRVVPGAKVPCGECGSCRSGNAHLCRRGAAIGRQIPGLFAEYGAIPAVVLATVPDAVSDSEGACIQPFTTSVAAVETAQLQVGDTVAIFGQGAIGLGTMQVARVSGGKKVIGVDVRPEALELASKLGADEVINATRTDPAKAIMEITDGVGADVVFECAGGSRKQGLAGADTLLQAVKAVRDCGKVQQVATIGGKVELDLIDFRKKNVAYLFTRPANMKTLLHSIDLVATRRVQLAPTVTHILHGLDKVPLAFEITGNKAKYRAVNPAQVVVSSE